MSRIAVVDDEEVIRSLVVELLGAGGHEVVAFDARLPAERALASALPDLLVTDVDLPDGSGLELVARLRAQGGAARLPVLVLSGLEAGGDGLDPPADRLSKPFTPRELLERVEALLAGE